MTNPQEEFHSSPRKRRMSTNIQGHQEVHGSLKFRDPINNLREEFSHYDNSAIATLERPVLILSLFLLVLSGLQDIIHDSMVITTIALEIANVLLLFLAQILFGFIPKPRAIFQSLFRLHSSVSFEGPLTLALQLHSYLGYWPWWSDWNLRWYSPGQGLKSEARFDLEICVCQHIYSRWLNPTNNWYRRESRESKH